MENSIFNQNTNPTVSEEGQKPTARTHITITKTAGDTSPHFNVEMDRKEDAPEDFTYDTSMGIKDGGETVSVHEPAVASTAPVVAST